MLRGQPEGCKGVNWHPIAGSLEEPHWGGEFIPGNNANANVTVMNVQYLPSNLLG